MSGDKWLKCFNDKFEEFVKELIELYPDDKDFKILKNSFNLLKMADFRKPFSLFIVYSVDYESYVMNKDETFFLNHDYDEIKQGDSNFTDTLMMKLKGYWKTLTEENKEIIWKYLTLFFSLKTKINTI
jgi:hypothetical protein